ncbi:MAG: CDP-alcohol phosphatidyltransferase family protein, partial [Mycobacteriales bacterium]
MSPPEPFVARWSELHGGLDPSPLVRRWLAVVSRLGAPLARAGVHPDALTWASLGAAALVLAVPGPLGALLVLLSALLDGLDGTVAVLQDRVGRSGHVLDSAVDRCGEALFVLALVRVGGPAGLGAACGFGVLLLEYVRARAGEVLAVTVAERPTRVLVTAAALALHRGTAGLAVLTALTAVGLGQL